MRATTLFQRAAIWLLIVSLLLPASLSSPPANSSPPRLMPFHPDLVEKWERHPEQAPALFSSPPAPKGLNQPPQSALQPKGTFNALLLLVDFGDKPSSVEATYFDDLVFGTSRPSVWHYFDEVSYGQLDIVTLNLPGDSGWFRAPQNYAYYVGGRGGTGSYPNNAQKLVEELVALADPHIDFSPYDNNDDGTVDALMVVHAGTGREATGKDNDIHSHMWQTSTPVPVDGVKVHHYAMMPEYWPKDWATLPNMTIGVFAHELGHIFGLPDLYDTDGSSHGVGRWCLMGAGSWNGLVNGVLMGSSPAHPNAWARIELGWAAPAVLTADLPGAQIKAVAEGGTIYRLWTQGAVGDEYFLVENRQPVGYDAALPGFGLLIWHVDEAMSHNDWEVRSHYNWLAPTHHYKVALEQADGNLDLERRTNPGDAGDPFPGTRNNRNFTFRTIPNSSSYYSPADTLVMVANISNSASVMTADLRVSTAAAETGILVQVLNQNGKPARDAWVLAYSDTSCWPDALGLTREDGWVWLHVPDGTYTLVASSWKDHFLVVKENVTAPSSVTLDTTGTVEVSFSVKDLAGNPMGADIQLKPYPCFWGWGVGSTDQEGKLTVNATPMDYWGASAASGEKLYFLFKRDIEVAGPTSIDLDASRMPTGQLKLEDLVNFDSMWVSPHSQSYRGGSSFEVGEGDVMVLSADSYWISGWLRAQDDEGNIWDYRLSMGEVAVPTEGMAGISAGGSFSISTTPDSPIYGRAATSGAAPPEAVEGLSSKVTLHNDFADSFGNRLSEIRKWSPAAQPTPGQEQLPFFSSRDVEGKISLSPLALQPGSPWVWERIYPHLVVTDPNGNKIVDESSWDVWRDFSFTIPHDAAEGEYTVELSLDTGPHQGVINAVSSFQVQGEATGILVQVLNQDGEPARFARVVAYSDTSRCPDAWGWTGGSGFAWLDVPDGTYALVASSWNDHFLIVQEDVTAPSSVTMNTAGTVEVSFSVKDLAGNPMRADIQLKPYPCFWGWVGSTDVEGKLTVNATPMDYWGASAASRGKLYFLFERDIEVAGPTSVDLDASQMPTGQLKLEDLVNFDSMGVSPHSQSYRGGSSFEVGEGDVMVLSADSYSLWGGFRKQDDEGNEWEYHVSMGEVAVSTGAMASISAGGSFSISTTPGKPEYSPGEEIVISNLFTDSFDNRLSGIWKRSPAAQLAPGQEQTPFFSPLNLEGEMSLSPIAVQPGSPWVWERIYPHLVVTDPDGNKIVDENSRELWWRDFSFIIPHDAAEGEYIVELSLDTGPHQGVINAQNTFHVDRRLPGDANDDGIVDTADLTLVAVSFNRRADDQGFDPASDINADGIVDIFDLVWVGRNFGRR